MSKRLSGELDGTRSGDPKTIRSVDGTRKTVAEFGSKEQIRAGITAQVSPDSTRFVPPQVGRKLNGGKN